MKRTIQGALLATVALTGGAMAATVNQGTGYALSETGTSLFTYNDLANPVPPSEFRFVTDGGVLTAVDAITYRPNTDEFYAYRDQGNLVYKVDLTAPLFATLTQVEQGMDNVMTSVPTVGFDFNNALDAARIVSTADENLVFFPQGSVNPADGTTRDSSVIRATDLFYVPGDANAGANPSVFANAYTNAVAQMQVNAATQQQYVLDSELDILATLANNSGELRTLGKLTVNGQALDFSNVGGFDILSPASGDNLGLALLNVFDDNGVEVSNLYSFALPTMAGDIEATFVSTFGEGYKSFAVKFNGQPEVAPVPVPAAGLLLLGALAGLGAMRLRRRG